jgi:Flp pilus assembly protein TadG
MRRLSPRRPRRLGAARLAEERGAVAVMVALLMVPLIGVGAIAIDVASLYSDRAQLLNAADAAAIAVALDCARGNCGNQIATATDALTANTTSADAADATLRTPTVSVSGRTISVTTAADQAHWFAPVLGIDSTRVTASAKAAWAPTTRGRANFPLAISWCEFQRQIANYPLTNTTSHRISGQTQVGGSCTGPTGQPIMSGYAVTTPDTSSVCRTTSTFGATVAWYPGMFSGGLPASCTGAYLASLIGTDILFPVWDQVTGSGGNLRIRVYGYAAFHITGYDVYSADPALYGWFTYAAQQSDATTNTTTSAPDLGARSVYLQG